MEEKTFEFLFARQKIPQSEHFQAIKNDLFKTGNSKEAPFVAKS